MRLKVQELPDVKESFTAPSHTHRAVVIAGDHFIVESVAKYREINKGVMAGRSIGAERRLICLFLEGKLILNLLKRALHCTTLMP